MFHSITKLLIFSIKRIFFPSICPLCEKIVDKGGFCVECYKKINFIARPCCVICSRPSVIDVLQKLDEFWDEFDGLNKEHLSKIARAHGEYDNVYICQDCLRHKKFFNQAIAAIIYDENSKKMMMRYKYGEATYLTQDFADLMIEALLYLSGGKENDLKHDSENILLQKKSIFHRYKFLDGFDEDKFLGENLDKSLSKILDKFDIIIPVPQHHKKFSKRIFNPPTLLAKSIARKIGKNVILDVLVKEKYHKIQGDMTIDKRIQNVKDTFCVQNLKKICKKRVLLVDDVYTTGATGNECAKILKANGAMEVTVLCVMRAGV